MTSTDSPPASQPAAAPCAPWTFWATTAWGVAILAVWMLVQAAALLAVFAWTGLGDNATPEQIEAIASSGVSLSVVTLIATPVAVAMIWLAIRTARCGFSDYLALRRPARSDVLLGLACLVVLLPLGDLSSYLSGRDIVPAFVIDMYKSAREPGHLVLLALALVIGAPLMEELVFRGFLLRGYAASRIGVIAAVVLTSIGWAALHIQYDLFYIVQIFILGCVFGWLRLRSGTTTLPLLLHALVNLTVLVQVAYIVGRQA